MILISKKKQFKAMLNKPKANFYTRGTENSEVTISPELSNQIVAMDLQKKLK